MCFVLLSFFLVIVALLVRGGVGFAIENPADTTIDYTLTGDPNCTNYGTIDAEDKDEEHGMYVEGKDNEGVSHYASNFGKVITRGWYAYGMYAESGAIATNENEGTITTLGDWAHSMVAEDGSTATNNGHIETEGWGSCGISAEHSSTAINNGRIETNGEWAEGMYAWDGSTATNNGSIITQGKEAHGMYVEKDSIATNNGHIETEGNDACGMLALDGSTATNNGSIITQGQNAYGMTNFSYGVMVASPEDNSGSATAVITNNGSISTYGNWAHGMYIRGGYFPIPLSTAINNGSIETNGLGSFGMMAGYGSTATNNGSIITQGQNAYGMTNFYLPMLRGTLPYGADNSYGVMVASPEDNSGSATAVITNNGSISTYGNWAHGVYIVGDYFPIFFYTNSDDNNEFVTKAVNNGDITTQGEVAFGMVALYDSTATNESVGTIATYGKEAYGMYAEYNSKINNFGNIITKGEKAYGMYARIPFPYDGYTPVPLSAAKVINSGTIATYGNWAHGMYIRGYYAQPPAPKSFDDDISDDTSTAINTGTITVTGEGADAVYVDNSTFTNSGTLDSLRGNAITSVNSTVTLEDGTKLPNSHNIVGDDDSTLNVNMAGDLAAVVKFGAFNKDGKGTMTLEKGSYAGATKNSAGTLRITPNTTFVTNTYTQMRDASLYIYFPESPNMDVALSVAGNAEFAGNVTIDYTNQPLPGKYKHIYVAGERSNDFDSVSFVNPGGIYKTFMPQWVPGNSWYYISLVDYAFSEQALGLVSAIEDWSLLRWIMANHLQDVASEIDNLEAGKKVYYAHFLANKTDRNPTGGSPLGYESDTRGLSFGFDEKVDDKTIWGMYVGYTEKDIDFTDVLPACADWEEQDSWHIGAYISKRFDKWIISDTLTYRSTDHDSFRRQKDGNARASFDSWAVTNDIRAGYVVKEIGENSRWEIVPEVGLNVGYFNRDGYRETNGYTYGDYDTTVTEGVIGVRFKGEFISKDGSRFSPFLRLSYVNVLSGDDVTIDQSWYGVKSWYTEKLDDDYFVADLGMTLYTAGNFDMSLNYNGRFGDDSYSHGGWLRLEWKQ